MRMCEQENHSRFCFLSFVGNSRLGLAFPPEADPPSEENRKGLTLPACRSFSAGRAQSFPPVSLRTTFYKLHTNFMINFLRAWKFETGFLLIIGAALLVWAATVYFSPGAQQQRDAEEYLERLQADYANDTFGGATPEETLSLFIAALEKGDIELASKYFLPEDREKWSQNIESVQKNNHINEMVDDLSRAEKSKQGIES